MTAERHAARAMWKGKYISGVTRGTWEYVERCGGIDAVVILAEHDGKVILVEQIAVPLGSRCIELPAGLVGDEDPDATVEETAVKELEEETGFTAERIERLGRVFQFAGNGCRKLHPGPRARRAEGRRRRRQFGGRHPGSTSSRGRKLRRSSKRSVVRAMQWM